MSEFVRIDLKDTRMEDYRERFYRAYASTHLTPRKGSITRQSHETQYRIWDRLLGQLLPVDISATVVDLGCGSGSIVQWLSDRGYANSIGVDKSSECVTLAKSLGINVIQSELMEFMASKPETAEFVVLRNVLEHHNKSEAIQLLCEINRFLKTGGRLFIQVPNSESAFGARTRYADYTHEQAFTQTSLAQLLLACGYSNVTTGAVGPFHTGLHWRMRWWVVKNLYLFLLQSELGKAYSPIVTQDLYSVASVRKEVSSAI